MSEVENPTGGTPEEGTPGATGADPQDELNKTIQARVAREQRKTDKVSKELENALRTIEEMKKAQQTEAERALEDAKKEARESVVSEYETKLKAERIDSELKVQLLARGMDADLVHVVKAKATIEGLDDIPGAIDDVLGTKEWAKPKAPTPGQSGRPSGKTGEGVTIENVGEYIARVGHRNVDQEKIKELLANAKRPR